MTYTYYHEETDQEVELDITYDYESGQAWGLEQEPLPAGITEIYAVSKDGVDWWGALPLSDQRTIEKELNTNPWN